jgi:hypothetical protein
MILFFSGAVVGLIVGVALGRTIRTVERPSTLDLTNLNRK